jgi:hypothetical protein
LRWCFIIEEQGNEDDVSPSQTILHSSTHTLSHVQENHLFLFNCIICFKQQRWCDEAPPRTADYHIYCAAMILNVAIIPSSSSGRTSIFHPQGRKVIQYGNEWCWKI